MKGALEVMARLCARHRVYIASAATEFPGSFRDKMDWVARNLPQIPTARIIFCGDKSILNMNYLLDDTPGHFAGLGGTGLLFDAPHNRHEHGFHRVSGWDQVEATIELHQCRARTSGIQEGLLPVKEGKEPAF